MSCREVLTDFPCSLKSKRDLDQEDVIRSRIICRWGQKINELESWTEYELRKRE